MAMNKFQILLFLTLITSSLMAYSQDKNMLEPYQGKNRILLVFSPTESTLEKQLAIFTKNQEGMQDRDLLVFKITKESIHHPNGSQDGKEAADLLRSKYQLTDNQFSVILIGKDGTEKLRQSEVLDAEKLFAVIDAMPMRKQEMRNTD